MCNEFHGIALAGVDVAAEIDDAVSTDTQK